MCFRTNVLPLPSGSGAYLLNSERYLFDAVGQNQPRRFFGDRPGYAAVRYPARWSLNKDFREESGQALLLMWALTAYLPFGRLPWAKGQEAMFTAVWIFATDMLHGGAAALSVGRGQTRRYCGCVCRGMI